MGTSSRFVFSLLSSLLFCCAAVAQTRLAPDQIRGSAPIRLRVVPPDVVEVGKECSGVAPCRFAVWNRTLTFYHGCRFTMGESVAGAFWISVGSGGFSIHDIEQNLEITVARMENGELVESSSGCLAMGNAPVNYALALGVPYLKGPISALGSSPYFYWTVSNGILALRGWLAMAPFYWVPVWGF